MSTLTSAWQTPGRRRPGAGRRGEVGVPQPLAGRAAPEGPGRWTPLAHLEEARHLLDTRGSLRRRNTTSRKMELRGAVFPAPRRALCEGPGPGKHAPLHVRRGPTKTPLCRLPLRCGAHNAPFHPGRLWRSVATSLGCPLAPGPALDCSRFGSSRSYRQGHFSDVTCRAVCRSRPQGSYRSLCLSTCSQKGGADMTPIKRWPLDLENGEPGEHAVSLLSLDTLPGRPPGSQRP